MHFVRRLFAQLKTHWRLVFSLTLAGLLCWAHIAIVLDTFVVDTSGAIRTTYSGYGDIPLHLTQVSRFAFGQLGDLEEPIFAGTRIAYPFGINAVSGLLLRMTGAWRFSFLMPIVVCVLLLHALLFIVGYTMTRRVLWAPLLALLVLFGGGWGGWSVARDAIREGSSWSEFKQHLVDGNISTVTRWDAKWPEQNIVFGAPLGLVLVHQRTFFPGIVGVLLAHVLLWEGVARRSQKYLYAGGVVLGSLPLFHTHSFVAGGLILIVVTLWGLLRGVWWGIPFIKTGVLALILAVPQVLFLVSGKPLGSDGDFAMLRLGWMVDQTIDGFKPQPGHTSSIFSVAYIQFLWMNLGTPLLALLGLSCAYIARSMRARFPHMGVMLAVAWMLFLVVQTVRFQPWDYDNNKLLVYMQFATMCAVLYVFARVKLRALAGVGLALSVGASIFSGVIDAIPRLAMPEDRLPVIFDAQARGIASFIRDALPNERIITSTTHTNPVPALTGKSVFVGYPGWLWTRSLPYGPREDLVRAFFKNPAGDTTLLDAQYPAKYVLLDDAARKDFGAQDAIFQKIFRLIVQSGQYALYERNAP
ncbi:MAG: hypothetical protein AAB463_02180 [Patescibacteria group bacterium]